MAKDDRFLVSGWEDDLNDIDEEKHPHGKESISFKKLKSHIIHQCYSWVYDLEETPAKEILWAAEKGELEKMKSLVEANPSLIHVKDKDGYTPLHRACYGNFVEMVEFLIGCGANISARTQMLWTPLHSCCQWNHYDCAIKLMQAGADVNATTEGGAN